MATDSSKPARLSRQEAKARTRGLLLDAAAQVFARRGYAGASVDDVAEAAGFSTGALYSNFAGKEDLFIALLTERNRERNHEVIAAVLDPAASGTQRRATIAELLLGGDDDEEAMLQAEFWLFAMRHPELRRRIAVQVTENRDALAQALSEWARRHQRPATVAFDELATILIAVFRGLIQTRHIDPELVPTELYATASRWLIEGATRGADKSG